MHTSELFLTFVRRLIFSFFVILLMATASRAQNGRDGWNCHAGGQGIQRANLHHA